MPKYKWKQIEKHSSQQSCWIVIQKKVFDATNYLAIHPGGRWIILQYGGKDASAGLQRTIHSPVAVEMMNDFYIGQLEQ